MDCFLWPFCACLLPLPLLVWAVSKYFTPHTVATKSDALFVPFFTRLTNLNHSILSISSPIRSLWLWLAWICFIVATMRPISYITNIPHFHEARNIMLAIDFSTSMARRDFKIMHQAASRIDVVKSVVRDFIDKRKGDNLGLIVFGTQAFTLAPLSQDMKTLDELFADVDLGIAGEKTAIGDALALAVKNTASIPTGKKVIIILSDGYNNSGSVSIAQAITLAQKQNIAVYTIGIGTSAQADNSLLSAITGSQHTWDEATLLTIAEKTGGHYFRAQSTKDLQDVYHKIDTLETAPVQAPDTKPRQELFYIPLLLGLLFWILAEYKRKKA